MSRIIWRGLDEQQVKHTRTEVIAEELRYLDRPHSTHPATPEEDLPM